MGDWVVGSYKVTIDVSQKEIEVLLQTLDAAQSAVWACYKRLESMKALRVTEDGDGHAWVMPAEEKDVKDEERTERGGRGRFRRKRREHY